jgi:hypothetical protein
MCAIAEGEIMKADGLPLPDQAEATLQAVYEASPGHHFDLALGDAGFCSPASGDYWCIHNKDTFFGYFVLDRVRLAPLTLEESVLHTRHLRCISTRQDLRGVGLWSTVLTKMIELADLHGVFLHAISYPFQMEMPPVSSSEDFLAFIDNEDDYFIPLTSWKKQKKASKDLLKKYLEIGFCRFRYPCGNGFVRRWARDNLGIAVLPDSLEPTISRQLKPYAMGRRRYD